MTFGFVRRISAMPLNIAVVGGSGLIGKRHCQHVTENERAELCAIVDPSSAARLVADEYHVPVYASIEAMLESGRKPDAAIVCTPNATHVPLSMALLANGVHVLCEKPISSDVDSGLELVQAAQRAHARLLIGHHRRFNPYIIALKHHLDSGCIGKLTAMTAAWATLKPPEYFSGANAWRSEQSGGGVVLINLIHDVDLLQYLLGPIVRIHAERSIGRRSTSEGGVEEGAALILRFASGVVGTVIVSDNVASDLTFEHSTGENPHLPQRSVDIYHFFGTDGTLAFPSMSATSYSNVQPSWQSVTSTKRLEVANPGALPLAEQLDHFVDVCEKGTTPLCSGEDALRALAVCSAIRQALQSKDGYGTIDLRSAH